MKGREEDVGWFLVPGTIGDNKPCRLTRKVLIDMIVDSDVDNGDGTGFEYLLRYGFVGYESRSNVQLIDLAKDLDLIKGEKFFTKGVK